MSHRHQHSPSLSAEDLKFISYCPFCKASKKAMASEVLNETEGTHLVHLHCENCQNAVLALVLSSPSGLTSLGIATDLSKNDVARLRQFQAELTIDDLLDFHSETLTPLTFLN